jgi:hypothetical protein
MRAIVIAITALALVTTGAYAQSKLGGGQQRGKDDQEKLLPGEQPKPVVDEKKYKSAVDVMGDQSQKYDPWGGIREKPPEKGKPR